MPATAAIGLALGGYDFRPSPRAVAEVVRRETAALRAFGREGRAVLRDIDVFVAGINHWYGANRPGFTRFTRADVFAFNALKAQLLGEGGGRRWRTRCSSPRRASASAPGAGPGRTGTCGSGTSRNPSRRRGGASAGRPPSATGAASSSSRTPFRSAAPALPEAVAASPRREASNVLIVSGRRSRNGRPVFVGGPQIGYTFPGLTLEMRLYAPGIRVRGATSAPFPGYMLIGRGERSGWTLTSAGVDIVDTYAERLCGGSRLRYRFLGRCRRMEKLRAGTIVRGGASMDVVMRRTVHGPVVGYAREAGTGRRVALSRRRASFGRETTDQILFRRLTRWGVRTARDFVRATAPSPQTFNAFWASDRETAFVTTGRLPLPPRHVDPDLPVSGEGRFEWRGVLP